MAAAKKKLLVTEAKQTPDPHDGLTRHRMEREQMWLDEATLQAEVLKPYLENLGFQDTPEEYIERLNKRAEVVLRTNENLTQILEDEAENLKTLETLLAEKRVECKTAEEDLQEVKQLQATSFQNMKNTKRRGLLEECRLRERVAEVKKKCLAITHENRRLERLRHEESIAIKRNYDIIANLKKEEANLEVRKNALEDYERQMESGMSDGKLKQRSAGPGLIQKVNSSRSTLSPRSADPKIRDQQLRKSTA